jgi:hypothetical protein
MECNIAHTNSLEANSSRLLTLADKKQLRPGQHIYVMAGCCCYLRVKVNGMPKTWKRQPNKVKIPYKYGMGEYGYITELTLVRVEE